MYSVKLQKDNIKQFSDLTNHLVILWKELEVPWLDAFFIFFLSNVRVYNDDIT